MKNILLCFLCSSLYTISACSQTPGTSNEPAVDKGIFVSVSSNIPLGEFSSTHLVGAGIDCSPSSHSFGLFKKIKIATTWNGGLAYYFGKKETINGYSYDYPNYLFIHAFGGILYNPVKSLDITLTAGPALGVYNSKSRFNVGSKLELGYHLNANIAISPGLIVMRESGADPIWAASFKVAMAL